MPGQAQLPLLCAASSLRDRGVAGVGHGEGQRDGVPGLRGLRCGAGGVERDRRVGLVVAEVLFGDRAVLRHADRRTAAQGVAHTGGLQHRVREGRAAGGEGVVAAAQLREGVPALRVGPGAVLDAVGTDQGDQHTADAVLTGAADAVTVPELVADQVRRADRSGIPPVRGHVLGAQQGGRVVADRRTGAHGGPVDVRQPPHRQRVHRVGGAGVPADGLGRRGVVQLVRVGLLLVVHRDGPARRVGGQQRAAVGGGHRVVTGGVRDVRGVRLGLRELGRLVVQRDGRLNRAGRHLQQTERDGVAVHAVHPQVCGRGAVHRDGVRHRTVVAERDRDRQREGRRVTGTRLGPRPRAPGHPGRRCWPSRCRTRSRSGSGW